MMKKADSLDHDQTYLCRFSESIRTRACACANATKSTHSHRQRVRCQDPAAQAVCSEWMTIIRDASRFTLGIAESPSALPMNTALKVQIGSLLGIQESGIEDNGKIIDIARFLKRVRKRSQGFAQLPLNRIVQSIHKHEPGKNPWTP